MTQQNDPPAEQELLRRQYRAVLGEYKTVNDRLAELSWNLAELEQQIAALSHPDGAALPSAAQRRLSDLRRWRDLLEERTLGQMYRADALAAELSALRSAMGRV